MFGPTSVSGAVGCLMVASVAASRDSLSIGSVPPPAIATAMALGDGAVFAETRCGAGAPAARFGRHVPVSETRSTSTRGVTWGKPTRSKTRVTGAPATTRSTSPASSHLPAIASRQRSPVESMNVTERMSTVRPTGGPAAARAFNSTSTLKSRATGASGDGLDRDLEELDGRAPLRRARVHRVQRLVPAAHRLLRVEERDADALAGLAVHEHQHLGALEAGRRRAGFDLAANHADGVVDLARVALECGYACVHIPSLRQVDRESPLCGDCSETRPDQAPTSASRRSSRRRSASS